MKKFFILALLAVILISVGVGYFCSPVEIEEYGVTTVQYDEKTGTYFVEVTQRYEVEPTAETKVGMPVSYYKTEDTVPCINSVLVSKEEIQARVNRDVWTGVALGGGICCVLLLCLFLVERCRQKRIDALMMKFDKAEAAYLAKKAHED